MYNRRDQKENSIFEFLIETIKAYKNKFTNKAFGYVSIKTKKKRKGVMLLSFVTGPFTLAPWEYFSDPHSNYFTSPEVARLFLERGYDVDVINWNDTKFIPKKKYKVCVDMQYNLERLSKYLPKDCIKIMLLIASHPSHQNQAEFERLTNQAKRRGRMGPMRREDPITSNPQIADFIGGYGNKYIHGTYAKYGKKIYPIPVPTMDLYPFPENKDFAEAKKNFLWFGGGGAILKGLDLVVEAFAQLPQFNLHIVGPAPYEREFQEIYEKELKLPNIKLYGRPKINQSGEIKVAGLDLLEVFNKCACVVYVSASEGGGGAVVHAMQDGIFPISSPYTGLDERIPSIILENPSVEKIKEAVLEFSKIEPEEIKKKAREIWSFVREHHSKEAFTREYKNFLDNIVKLP